MTFRHLVRETYDAVTVNLVRSGLTVLGIVIGIGSVIAMVSIGQGAQATIESSIQSIGSNLVLVVPGAQRGPGSVASSGRGSAQTLTQADAAAVQENVSLARAVAPEVSRRYQVVVKGKNTNTQVTGTVPAYPDVRNVQIAEGIFITDAHVRGSAKVAVLGPTTKADLFGEDIDALGKTVRINKIDFTVVGITASKGGTGFGNQDDVIFVPLPTAQRFLSGDEYVTTISIAASDASVMSDIQQQVTELLLQRHRISDPTLADFTVLNQADIVSAASAVTGTFTALLGAIAGISLLVGGIGIMNMMLTTVTERTREIGLRKAIGAKRGDISAQFLAEAVTLTSLGGALGMLLGWGLGALVEQFAGITTSVSLSSVALALGVSGGIGILFGYYPARRASRLNPIDALRYE